MAALNLPLGNEGDAAVMPHQVSASLTLPWNRFRLGAGVLLSEGGASYHAGIENRIFKAVELRLGLGSLGYESAAAGVSGGLGLNYGSNLSADYAVAPAGALGLLQTLSLKISFGQGFAGFAERKAAAKALVKEQPNSADAEPVDLNLEDGAGDFEIESNVKGRTVTLKWKAPAAEKGLTYNVTMGMLAEASFRKMTEKPIAEGIWEAEMGLAGATYYFRVRSLRLDGSEGPLSRVKAVHIP